MEKDYSRFITNPSPLQDNRSFCSRLFASLKPSVFFDFKKDKKTDSNKRGIGIKIEGGVEF